MPNDKRIDIKEVGAKSISIICKESGLPIVRANEYGMFCNVKDCKCEKESRELKNAIKLFKK